MPIAQDIIDRTLLSSQGEQGYAVVETLLDNGYEAWWVGGCVRDMLLEEIPKDIDIATSAHPHEVAKLFPKHDDTKSALGAVIVSVQGHTFEVTTFREDHTLSNGRQPQSVQFSDKETDAKRRDITINALYWNPISSELYDPCDGLHDLNEKLIRIIGEPSVRIEEDSLRLLRIVRFRALLDGQYHPETFKALHEQSKLIQKLSGMRRFQEIEKILMGPRPHIAFEDLWETDILQYLIPELHACKGVAQPAVYHKEGDVWSHIMKAISSFLDDHKADTRFAALLHDIGKPSTFSIEEDRIHFNNHAKRGGEIASALLDDLQCTAARRDKIKWIIEHHMMMGSFATMDDTRKAHWYYHPWFIELLQVFWLDIAGSEPSHFDLYDTIIKDYNIFLDANPRPVKPLLSGDEIMTILGIQPGEQVGEILRRLHEAQVNKQISTKEDAKKYLESQM